jgi:hypothetical protein
VWRDIDDLIVDKLGPERAELFNEMTRELKYALGGHVIGHPDHPAEQASQKTKPSAAERQKNQDADE